MVRSLAVSLGGQVATGIVGGQHMHLTSCKRLCTHYLRLVLLLEPWLCSSYDIRVQTYVKRIQQSKSGPASLSAVSIRILFSPAPTCRGSWQQLLVAGSSEVHRIPADGQLRCRPSQNSVRCADGPFLWKVALRLMSTRPQTRAPPSWMRVLCTSRTLTCAAGSSQSKRTLSVHQEGSLVDVTKAIAFRNGLTYCSLAGIGKASS